MARWDDTDLLPFDSLREGLEAVENAAGIARTAQSFAKDAVEATAEFLPSTAVAADALLSAAFTVITGGIADALSLGLYELNVFPQAVSWSQAVRQDAVDAVTATRDREKALYDRLIQSNAAISARARGAYERFWDAEKQLEVYRKKNRFSSPVQLQKSFTYDEFVAVAEQSLTDTGDPGRPQFGATSSVTTGIVVLVEAPSVTKFADLIAAMATWKQDFALNQQALMLSNLILRAGEASNQLNSASYPPDWQYTTVARALGLEPIVAELKRAGGTLGLSTFTDNPTVERIVDILTLSITALDQAIDRAKALILILDAIAALSGNLKVLLVPPEQGALNVGGSTFPKMTAGVDGFIQTMKDADNPPTANWVAGFLLLGGFPTGANPGALTQELYNSSALQGAITSARNLYSIVSAPFA